MPSSGTISRVALVRTDVSAKLSASIIRVARIGELGKALAVTSNATSVVTRTTRRNIPEDAILYRNKVHKQSSAKWAAVLRNDVSRGHSAIVGARGTMQERQRQRQWGNDDFSNIQQREISTPELTIISLGMLKEIKAGMWENNGKELTVSHLTRGDISGDSSW
jgi:hypothetical protein